MATHFQVFVSGMPGGSTDDWSRAMNAPDSELPSLSEEQREVAKKLGIPEDEYRRGVLVGKYSEERHLQRGRELGKHINDVIEVLGGGYMLEALIREGTNLRWVARVTGPDGVKNIAIPFELADNVIDSSTVQDLEKMKRILLESLNRRDLLRAE